MVEQKSKTKKGSIQNSSVKPNLSIDWSQPSVEMLIFVSSMQPRLLNVSQNIIEIASNERVFSGRDGWFKSFFQTLKPIQYFRP